MIAEIGRIAVGEEDGGFRHIEVIHHRIHCLNRFIRNGSPSLVPKQHLGELLIDGASAAAIPDPHFSEDELCGPNRIHARMRVEMLVFFAQQKLSESLRYARREYRIVASAIRQDPDRFAAPINDDCRLNIFIRSIEPSADHGGEDYENENDEQACFQYGFFQGNLHGFDDSGLERARRI